LLRVAASLISSAEGILLLIIGREGVGGIGESAGEAADVEDEKERGAAGSDDGRSY